MTLLHTPLKSSHFYSDFLHTFFQTFRPFRPSSIHLLRPSDFLPHVPRDLSPDLQTFLQTTRLIFIHPFILSDLPLLQHLTPFSPSVPPSPRYLRCHYDLLAGLYFRISCSIHPPLCPSSHVVYHLCYPRPPTISWYVFLSSAKKRTRPRRLVTLLLEIKMVFDLNGLQYSKIRRRFRTELWALKWWQN